MEMVTGWLDDHPGATEEEMAQWLFDTFSDLQLVPQATLRRMAREYIGAH